ncbi:hypothetical protein GUJ93_ZPchr0012g21660 [Zizania palustris]|uniref:DUF3741 domain-containing protein n=1 Tax=Zizania palustris TaxID=103762 RepID=A0A8J5WRK6_ZIZPA|nr:hypothetical protein GUJ93_ZPchr0012g21660 [Zizania palustris]
MWRSDGFLVGFALSGVSSALDAVPRGAAGAVANMKPAHVVAALGASIINKLQANKAYRDQLVLDHKHALKLKASEVDIQLRSNLIGSGSKTLALATPSADPASLSHFIADCPKRNTHKKSTGGGSYDSNNHDSSTFTKGKPKMRFYRTALKDYRCENKKRDKAFFAEMERSYSKRSSSSSSSSSSCDEDILIKRGMKRMIQRASTLWPSGTFQRLTRTIAEDHARASAQLILGTKKIRDPPTTLTTTRSQEVRRGPLELEHSGFEGLGAGCCLLEFIHIRDLSLKHEDFSFEPLRLLGSGPKPLNLSGLGPKGIDLRLELVRLSSPRSEPLQFSDSGLEGVDFRHLGLERLDSGGPRAKVFDLGRLLADQPLGSVCSTGEFRSAALTAAAFGEQGEQRALRQRDYLHTKR